MRSQKRQPPQPVISPEEQAELALLSKPSSERGQYQRAALKIMREHEAAGTIPTNIRFVFYEGVQRGLWEKHTHPGTNRSTQTYLSEALMWLREKEIIPWDWLEDETRSISDWRSADSVLQYLVDSIDYARINPWSEEPPPLIICEARSTRGPLEPTCRDYVVPICATNGQAGGFLRTDVAPYFLDDDGAFNDRQVGYVGDCELRGPGEQIEENTRRVLEEYVGHEIRWTRIALTQAQVDANPTLKELEITKTDNRNGKRYRAVECETVGQGPLIDMLREFLDARLPQPLSDVQEREEKEREQARVLLQRLIRRQR
jgi:hypothetical protein